MILNPSERLVRALIDQTTDDVIVWLFTIAHAESGAVHYKTNNREDIVSQGRTFDYFPVEFALPNDDGETISEVQIVLKSVQKELIDLIRRYTGGVTITAELVIADVPDNIEYELEDLEITGANYDKSQVVLSARPESLVDRRFPAHDRLPRTYPGMFK